jgi:hypothetical protein
MARKTKKPAVQTASSENALAFIQALQKEFPGTRRTLIEKQRLRDFLGKFGNDELRSVARRVMIDIMKRPARTIASDGYAPPQSPPPSPSREGGGSAAKTGKTKAKPTRRPKAKPATGAAKPAAARARRKTAKS